MKKHQKRLTMPRKWNLPRKVHPWAPKLLPGPHDQENSLPLGIIIRDILKLADNARETKKILGARNILVDGKVRKSFKFPVGFMDVISIPKNNEYYRLLLDGRGKLVLTPISKSETVWKLVKIVNKRTIKKGQFQLNLHDGRNILLEKNKFNTKDVIKLEIPTQKMLGHYPFEEGKVAMIIGGKHAGTISHIENVTVSRSSKPNIVTLSDGFSTIMDYVFVVGKKMPVIKIPEVSIV